MNFPKLFSVKLLTPRLEVLRYVHAKQISNLSEVVGSQMVELIGRLLKVARQRKWKFPKIFSKTVDKLENSSYSVYKLNISRTTERRRHYEAIICVMQEGQ